MLASDGIDARFPSAMLSHWFRGLAHDSASFTPSTAKCEAFRYKLIAGVLVEKQ